MSVEMDHGVSVRRSAEQWREIVSRFRGSGLSDKAFCAAEGLVLSTFRRWRSQFSEAVQAGSAGSAKARTGFVEVSGAAPVSAAWELELDLGEGVVLRLRRRC